MASTNQVNTVTTENVVPVGATYDANGNFITLVGAAGAPINTLSGGGTANGVAYLNGSKVLTTGSALTFDGTSLGLGAATPIAVGGYSVIRINGSTGGILELTSGNTRVLQIQSDGASAGAQITTVNNGSNPPLIFGVDSSEQMRLTSTGLGIGTSSPSSSAILDAQSTTKGVRMPNMTTTQKNAIASPAAGLMVFDTTLAKLCVYSGSAWQTITSV